MIFGGDRVQPIAWVRQALVQSRRIGRVDYRGRGIGSGFLVEGNWLGDHLADAPLFITCSYVCGTTSPYAVNYCDVTVVFEGMYDDPSAAVACRLSRMLHESPLD